MACRISIFLITLACCLSQIFGQGYQNSIRNFVQKDPVVSNYVQPAVLNNQQQYSGPFRQFDAPVRSFDVAPIARVSPVAQYVDETPKPFNFNYNFVDEYGNQQYREETADENGNVVGKYGYTDANGIYRQVEYGADAYGSRYQIETNEPGTKTSQPADVIINSQYVDVPYDQAARQRVYTPPTSQVRQAPIQNQVYTAPEPLRRQVFQAPIQNQVYTAPEPLRQQVFQAPVQRQEFLGPNRQQYTQSNQPTYSNGGNQYVAPAQNTYSTNDY